jgi:hypothetical protein
MGQTRQSSRLGMSASPPTSDVWLPRGELTLRANKRHLVLRSEFIAQSHCAI